MASHLSYEENNIIYGKNPVLEALNNPEVTIEKVLVQSNLRGELEKELRYLCKSLEVPTSKVPIEKLNKLTNRQNHQGVCAFISPIRYQLIDDIIAADYEKGKSPLLMVLENITDVRNVGAIARSAHVFGVSAIVFPLKNAARINEDSIRISAGALLKIPICRVKNMAEIFEICQNYGIKTIATDLHTEHYADEVNETGPLAVIMGSEDTGITLETRRASDLCIKIRQASDFDSLNVSVAAGIMLYEISKCRK